MRKTLFLGLVLVSFALVILCVTLLAPIVAGIASIAAITEGHRRGSGQPESWLRENYLDSCSAMGRDKCNDDRKLAEYITGEMGEDSYVAIVPPMMPHHGSVTFDDSELRRWLLLRGKTTVATKGVAAIIAVTPVSGTLPLSTYPHLFYFPSFHSALVACYKRYDEEVKRGNLSDFYAWAIRTDTLVLDWGWEEDAVKVVDTHNEKQTYLCVVYVAPVWEEYRKLYGDGQVTVNLPSNTMLNYVPNTGGLAEAIAAGIVDHCHHEMGQTLSSTFLQQLLRNLRSILEGGADAYRYSYGQVQMVCTVSAVGNVIRILPTPTPTPTATPTPTPTTTAMPRQPIEAEWYPTPTPTSVGP